MLCPFIMVLRFRYDVCVVHAVKYLIESRGFHLENLFWNIVCLLPRTPRSLFV
jgi:hypothetical protein